MRLLQNALVHSIMVVEGNKGKSSGFFGSFVGDDLHFYHLAETIKIVIEVLLSVFFSNS